MEYIIDKSFSYVLIMDTNYWVLKNLLVMVNLKKSFAIIRLNIIQIIHHYKTKI